MTLSYNFFLHFCRIKYDSSLELYGLIYGKMTNKSSEKQTLARVLIADETLMVREHLKAMLLELLGVIIVGEARDAGEVVEASRTLNPDVVILSFQLPGGPGLDTLRRVREMQPLAKVIVLTNLSSLEYRNACLKAGADFFFDKSLEIEKVVETVKTLIQDQGYPP